MTCLVCNAKMSFFVTKDFGGAYDLNMVRYYKCNNCGFVSSEEHYSMSEQEWEKLNYSYHQNYFETGVNHDDSKWLERLAAQAKIIKILKTFLSSFLNFWKIP